MIKATFCQPQSDIYLGKGGCRAELKEGGKYIPRRIKSQNAQTHVENMNKGESKRSAVARSRGNVRVEKLLRVVLCHWEMTLYTFLNL